MREKNKALAMEERKKENRAEKNSILTVRHVQNRTSKGPDVKS
jgi:hypothetical protein